MGRRGSACPTFIDRAELRSAHYSVPRVQRGTKKTCYDLILRGFGVDNFSGFAVRFHGFDQSCIHGVAVQRATGMGENI